MIIAIAGYRGFIGSHFRKSYPEHKYILLKRADLYTNCNELSKIIENADIVVNLAGYSVSKRWSARTKKRIWSSRIDVSKNLIQAINQLEKKPKIFLSASAIGIYQHNMEHSEDNYTLGSDFLSEVVQEWEKSMDEIGEDVKLIKMRLGLVLGTEGGALPRLVKLFKMGLGGVIGTGKQIYSFIHIEDVTRAMHHLIVNEGEGVYNFTAPYPVSNKVFTRSIASKLRRPAFFHVPSFIMKIVMGEASSIVTQGQTVYPTKLLHHGFKFNFATIDESMENLLKKR